MAAICCIFRGRRGDLKKILWHDGLRLSLYAKRLDRGKFFYLAARRRRESRRFRVAQLAYMLEGIDWRNPQADVAAQKRWVSVPASAQGGRKTWGHTYLGKPTEIAKTTSLRLMDPASRGSSRRRRRPEGGADRRAREEVGSRRRTPRVARARASEDTRRALIAAQKLRIAKLVERQAQRQVAVGALGAVDRSAGARLRGT